MERSPALEPANGRLDSRPHADAATPAKAARLRNPRLVVLPAASDASAIAASFEPTVSISRHSISPGTDFN